MWCVATHFEKIEKKESVSHSLTFQIISLSGSMSQADTTCLLYFILILNNTHFFDDRLMPLSKKRWNTSLSQSKCSSKFSSENTIPSSRYMKQMWWWRSPYHSSIRRWYVAKALNNCFAIQLCSKNPISLEVTVCDC